MCRPILTFFQLFGEFVVCVVNYILIHIRILDDVFEHSFLHLFYFFLVCSFCFLFLMLTL
jgi:hypothetical protein